MKYVHNPNASICDYCGKRFKTPYNLNAHRIKAHLTTSKALRTQCKLCDIWINENSLANHVSRIHNTSAETCSLCAKVLNCRISLKKHMLNVHGMRKHACSFCDKAFVSSTALKVRSVHFLNSSEISH